MKPERVMVVTDYDVVYIGQSAVARGRVNWWIVQDWQIGRFYDAGQSERGYIHPMETGLIKAGMFASAYDMHAGNLCATTY